MECASSVSRSRHASSEPPLGTRMPPLIQDSAVMLADASFIGLTDSGQRKCFTSYIINAVHTRGKEERVPLSVVSVLSALRSTVVPLGIIKIPDFMHALLFTPIIHKTCTIHAE